jgi:hypothetical protein
VFTFGSYPFRMFDVADSLRSGLQTAQRQLHDAQATVARANAGEGSRSVDAAMAGTARAAIFQEALLGAIHARLQEIKGVTR